MKMIKKGTLLAHTLIFVFGAVALAACTQPPNPTPPAAPSVSNKTSTPQPIPTQLPTTTQKPTDTAPETEPQVILLRGMEGCEQDLKILANQPVQLHYGVWGSLGKAYAENASDLLEIRSNNRRRKNRGEQTAPHKGPDPSLRC